MKHHIPLRAAAVAAWAALAAGAAWGQAGQTVKIGFIDPLSGAFANVGQNQLKSWQFAAEQFNKKNAAGVKFEFVSFDNKASPQESLNVLKAAIDQGIRYVVQGNGSGAALAISTIGSAGIAAHLGARLAKHSNMTPLNGFIRGAVILPEAYLKEPERRFPVLIDIPGFGGDPVHGRLPRPFEEREWIIFDRDIFVYLPHLRRPYGWYAPLERNSTNGHG